MSRPRRGTEAVFYDTFADWDVDDQAAALKVLEALHRQKQREERRLPDPHMIEKRQENGLFPSDERKARNVAQEEPEPEAWRCVHGLEAGRCDRCVQEM